MAKQPINIELSLIIARIVYKLKVMNNKLKKQLGASIGGFILEFVQSIVLALSVFVIVYLFIAQPNEVKGSSMLPNFVNGEYLLTDKISYLMGKPKRGDVIVFKAPPTEPCAEESCEYIKRIIGMPGDRVMVKEGVVVLNGETMNEIYLAEGTITMPGDYCREGEEVVVPENMVLAFGDNREHSRDGREFGPISMSGSVKGVIGKAFFKYWPPQSIGLVKKFN